MGIGILAIHGMGRQRPDYASILQNNLYDHLDAKAFYGLQFESIWYHGFQELQDKVWERMVEKPLDWIKLREFVLFYLSDAAASEIRADDNESVYQQIHRRVLEAIDALRIRLGNQDQPVVIIAHSLGCQVISNYIWDATHNGGIWKGVEPTAFQRLATARYMITSGCNIPLFVSALGKIEAIHPPNENFRWFNYYDRDDVLGWPLRPLSKGFANSYEDVVTEDIEINTGPTPFSHSQYWEDESFIKPVAKLISDLHSELAEAGHEKSRTTPRSTGRKPRKRGSAG